MLVFSGAGSGGRVKHCMTLIPSVFIETSGLPSMLKRACMSSLLFGVSVQIFIPPSCSTSPALPDPPSFTSFQVSTPQDISRATPRSMKPPVPLVVVLVMLDVAVLFVGCALRRPSRTEMEANVLSPDILYTIPLCGICVWQQLAPMSLWRVLGWRGLRIWDRFVAPGGCQWG